MSVAIACPECGSNLVPAYNLYRRYKKEYDNFLRPRYRRLEDKLTRIGSCCESCRWPIYQLQGAYHGRGL